MEFIANTAAKVQNLRTLHVPNQRDQEFKKQFYRLFKVDDVGNLTAVPCRFTAGRETRGITFIEEPGGGKTTTIRTFLQEAGFLATNPETGEPCYIEIQVPSPATLKSVGLTILAALDMEGVSVNAKEWEIWKVVKHRLGVKGISVLWLDEAQDLIMARSANETESSLRMLKSLMLGDNAVIPILSGTQRLAEMTTFDPQVSRRFTKIIPSDLQHGVDEDGLAQLIEYFCGEAGISTRHSTDLPARLITASRHRFGRAVENIINAIECALWEDSRVLTVEHFGEAWAMQEGCDPSANVFFSDHWLSIQLDKGAGEYEEARTRRQQKKLERV
ncbi:ATP-binding protein [Roseovarius sp. D0-M9]|uniref:ATP-binding protein n=1 Tax=Roseovarius sp. D0-M9 TaxID=3127117 RepID=UPI00300F7E94